MIGFSESAFLPGRSRKPASGTCCEPEGGLSGALSDSDTGIVSRAGGSLRRAGYVLTRYACANKQAGRIGLVRIFTLFMKAAATPRRRRSYRAGGALSKEIFSSGVFRCALSMLDGK